MGRGRAKAKQTKVARELKYNTPRTDFEALRAELSGAPPHARDADDDTAADDETADLYAKYADEE